jgi:Tol biopolymer transport system component
MRIKGQPVSEFVNTRPIPGLLFGWTPEGLGGVAYADRKRRLVVMDRGGRRHETRETKGVLLPAWSPDGTRLAWLEQSDSKRVVIYVADVRR